MLQQIGAALRLSLAKCNRYKNPIRYMYEINQVLNRYKSNLYKGLMNADIGYDPKEAFQLRIATNWVTKAGWSGKPNIIERSPITLYISGFIPKDKKQREQLEAKYNYAIDVTDIISLDLIASIKDDYHVRPSIAMIPDYKSELEMIQDKYPNNLQDINIYFTAESLAYGYYDFALQINGNVYEKLVIQDNINKANAMVVPPKAGIKCGRKPSALTV